MEYRFEGGDQLSRVVKYVVHRSDDQGRYDKSMDVWVVDDGNRAQTKPIFVVIYPDGGPEFVFFDTGDMEGMPFEGVIREALAAYEARPRKST